MEDRDFKIAVIISILLHVLMALVFWWAQNILTLHEDSARPIEVFLQQPDGGWRIADIAEPAVQKRPDRAKFIGLYDSSTPQETVARSRPHPSDKDSGLKGHEASGKGRDGAASSKKIEKKREIADLYAMKEPADKLYKKERNEVSSGAPIGSFATVPEDYYPDFNIGGHTYLNVLRYPEVEYFVRLKRIFKMTWDPISALRMTGQPLSVSRGQVSVVLAVSVDRKGELNELFVIRSSGLVPYDNEALRTVKASSPFSSPPERFVEKDGMLRMSWTFVVYL